MRLFAITVILLALATVRAYPRTSEDGSIDDRDKLSETELIGLLGSDDDSNKQADDDVSSSFYSSSSTSGGEHTIINGIDTSKLPPNYHKTRTVKKMIGGHPVYVNVTIDKTTDPVTGMVSVSMTESSGNGTSDWCSDTKKCKSGYYCDASLVNTCQKCSDIKQRCSDNAECCGKGTEGALCVYGICQTGYRKGDAGTLCERQSYCKAGTCCSRRFLKKYGTCKSLAKKGERCAASNSDINEMLHPGTCPCISGLVCSSGSWIENFFGGSMNALLGGNTCRLPGRGRTSSRSWWKRRDFRDDFFN